MLRHDARQRGVVQLRLRPQVDPLDRGTLAEDEADVGGLAHTHYIHLLQVAKHLLTMFEIGNFLLPML